MANGDATIECMDGGSESVDFETLFQLRLSEKLKSLFADNGDLLTQFVLVPSLRDVFHDFVYPQVCRACACVCRFLLHLCDVLVIVQPVTVSLTSCYFIYVACRACARFSLMQNEK